MPTSIKVLVLESDAIFAGELRRDLTTHGYIPTVLADGAAGLAHAAADRPDVILLSIELQPVGGFAICNKLKKDSALKNIPLIIMSTEATNETFDQHRKLKTAANDYIHKPIAFDALLERIHRLV